MSAPSNAAFAIWWPTTPARAVVQLAGRVEHCGDEHVEQHLPATVEVLAGVPGAGKRGALSPADVASAVVRAHDEDLAAGRVAVRGAHGPCRLQLDPPELYEHPRHHRRYVTTSSGAGGALPSPPYIVTRRNRTYAGSGSGRNGRWRHQPLGANRRT